MTMPKQWHRHHQPVVLGQAQAFADHVAVVEDVAVAEGRALGETGGTRGVLDVDRVVAAQLRLALGQGLTSDCVGTGLQFMPGQKT